MKNDKENPTETKVPTLEDAVRGAILRLLMKRMKQLTQDELSLVSEQITKIEKAKFV